MYHCRMVLEGPLFGLYFEKVEVSNFEVASDAFSTFKVLLDALLDNSANAHDPRGQRWLSINLWMVVTWRTAPDVQLMTV